MKIRVTEFSAGLGWKGSSHTEVVEEARFRKFYGSFLLEQLLENGHTGDAIGQGRGMFAELVSDE